MPSALAVDPISAMNDARFWALVGLAAGIYLFYRGFGMLQRRRLILNTPRSAVRGAALGPVEVCGKAVGPYTVISPLSALNCYYYRAVVWQNVARNWKKAGEETLCAPLFVDDGTGKMLVDPRGAEIDIATPFAHEYAASGFDSDLMPGYIRHFLHRHGVSGDTALKLEECCILPGDSLFVLGTLQESSGTAFVSQAAADLQCRGAIELLDPSAREKLQSSPAEECGFDLHPAAVLAKGPSRDTFFISWCSQREVVLTLQWRTFLYLWVGPLLILACLLLFVIRPQSQ